VTRQTLDGIDRVVPLRDAPWLLCGVW